MAKTHTSRSLNRVIESNTTGIRLSPSWGHHANCFRNQTLANEASIEGETGNCLREPGTLHPCLWSYQ